MNDLKAIQQMRVYRQHSQLVAETCLASWSRNTYYLTEELVVFCLADVSCPFSDDIADTLLQQEVSETFHPRKPKLPKVGKNIWPENGSLPSLATFVGPRSFLIFSLL